MCPFSFFFFFHSCFFAVFELEIHHTIVKSGLFKRGKCTQESPREMFCFCLVSSRKTDKSARRALHFPPCLQVKESVWLLQAAKTPLCWPTS